MIRLESTDGFGRTVAVHQGLGITFKDAAWNLRPRGRRAASLHRDLVDWANSDLVTDEQARKVRCSIMPNARVIIDYSAERPYDRARRRLVAHLHMAPPMHSPPPPHSTPRPTPQSTTSTTARCCPCQTA